MGKLIPRQDQASAVRRVLESRERGVQRVVLSSPTGGGKTLMMQMLIEDAVERCLKVSLYTNRRLLLEQTSNVLSCDHGIRAAGHKREFHLPVQVCMIQSESARLDKWPWHKADLVIVDECHLMNNPQAHKVLSRHWKDGAFCVGVTATPVDLGAMYDELIIAATKAELRKCGALVPAMHYGPDEPDLRHIGKRPLGEELTEKENVKAIMVHGVFGRVLEHYRRLNPEQKPAILFGPGVRESIWFAEQFTNAGIRAAHIDGENCWLDGELIPSTEHMPTGESIRQHILNLSKSGEVKVVCNRFVLREGIDAPWLVHGIFATIFGELKSYLQSGGRLLRGFAGKASAIIQDHGGNWWRHGSLNEEVDWNLTYTERMYAGLRSERLRLEGLEGGATEPVRCPQCTAILLGQVCRCGFRVGGRSRMVVQADGGMIELRGKVFKPQRVASASEEMERDWRSMYHRAKNAGMNFNQAYALFGMEHDWTYPPKTLPMMPKSLVDWFRKVSDVNRSDLIGQ